MAVEHDLCTQALQVIIMNGAGVGDDSFKSRKSSHLYSILTDGRTPTEDDDGLARAGFVISFSPWRWQPKALKLFLAT